MASPAEDIGALRTRGRGLTRVLAAVIKDVTNVGGILTDVQMTRVLQEACIRVDQAYLLLCLEGSLAIRATHVDQSDRLIIWIDDGLDVVWQLCHDARSVEHSGGVHC